MQLERVKSSSISIPLDFASRSFLSKRLAEQSSQVLGCGTQAGQQPSVCSLQALTMEHGACSGSLAIVCCALVEAFTMVCKTLDGKMPQITCPRTVGRAHGERPNVLNKRPDQTSELIKTRTRRVFHLLLLLIQQCLVIMPSKAEGRVSLALQAYTSN